MVEVLQIEMKTDDQFQSFVIQGRDIEFTGTLYFAKKK